jgi:hypothetical protein
MAISYLDLIHSVAKSMMDDPGLNMNYIMALRVLFSFPASTGFEHWLPAINQNIIFNMILLAGIVMWLLYWTLYNNKIGSRVIILLNIITPVNLTFVFLEITLQFSK